MRVLTYIYNSETTDDRVAWVLEQLDDREETIEYTDIGASDDPDGARREAMLAIGQATRVGKKPSGVFDDDGNPDFSAGAMITEEATGRRALHIGADSVKVLQSEEKQTDIE